MNKIKIAVLLLGVSVIAGCGNKAVQNNSSADAPRAEEKNVVNNVIGSIQAAMASGKTMKCTYVMNDPNGKGSTVTTYVDGKKYLTEMAVAGNTQKMIFDETAMYSWVDGQKTGTKITMTCSDELNKKVPQNENAPKFTGLTNEDNFKDALDVRCEPATDKIDFSIPTGITFTDQCESLREVMKNLPGGVK